MKQIRIMKKPAFGAIVIALILLAACQSTSEVSNSEVQSRQPNRERTQGRPLQEGRRGLSADQLIADMDKDNDQQLSQNEVEGRLKEDFSRIDTNGNGFLTKEEIESGRPERKPKKQN